MRVMERMANSESTSGRWRNVRRFWATPQEWALILLCIYMSFAASALLGRLGFLGFPVAIVGLVVLVVAFDILIRFGLAATIRKVWPPVPTAPPPVDPDIRPDLSFVTPPRPNYPAFAQARGQCGWILLKLDYDRDGRIHRYRCEAQAPGRAFEFAAAESLRDARLPADAAAPISRQSRFLMSFVLDGPDAPEWARSRLRSQEAPTENQGPWT